MERVTLMTEMKHSISEVLEKMFFLTLEFPEAVNEQEFLDSYNGEMLVSKLGFNGPFSGYFELLIPESLAISMAADFMGNCEEKVSPDQVHGTVKEIVNMVAGNTFGNFDHQNLMTLEIPEMVPHDKIRDGFDSRDTREEIFFAVRTLEYPLALKMVKKRRGC